MVSSRPCGKPEGPPKTRPISESVVCGRPTLPLRPSPSPTLVGLISVGRIEGDGDAVEAETRFVHDRWVEDVGLAEGADLAMRGAMIAPAGNGVALQCRLCADVFLEGIKAVQGVAGADLLQDVAGVLVDLHRAGRE